MAPKKEEEQGSLGEDTLECLILKRSLKWMKVENAIQASITRPLVTLGSMLSVDWQQQEPDLRDGHVADRKWSRAEEAGFMLIILNVPTVSCLLRSLLALVHSSHFFPSWLGPFGELLIL